MPGLFRNRRDAGRQLGALVAARHYTDPVVLGLPRGGVPVAYEIAIALGAPLDVFVVRKLGAPHHEELAIGAIASGGVRVLVPEVIRGLRVSEELIDAVTAVERIELERREREYRDSRPFPRIAGRTAIVVDDGVATGASMMAALRAVAALHPAYVVAAAPVMSRAARAELDRHAHACEAVVVPEPFYGVGLWYEDFAQTTDEEVRALLHEAYSRPTAKAAHASTNSWREPS
jgi:predicted phosphoribosyltransferase